MIFARKLKKISEFHMIFARKMPEFYVIFTRKIFFRLSPILGGHVPLLHPVSYAYGLLSPKVKTTERNSTHIGTYDAVSHKHNILQCDLSRGVVGPVAAGGG